MPKISHAADSDYMKNRGFDFSLVGREADHPLYPRRDIPGLNVLKFFCALMIVQIHTDSTLKPYVLYVCRIAVPLFLMITGYFMLNDRGGITAGKMAATFWKILKIFVYATVVSILFRFVTAPNEFIGNELSLKTLKWFVLSGSNFNAAYWYLYSLLQALVVILVFVRIGHPNWLWGVAIVGITANLLLGSYSFF